MKAGRFLGAALAVMVIALLDGGPATAQQDGDEQTIKTVVRAALLRGDSLFSQMTEAPSVDAFYRDYKKCAVVPAGSPAKCGIVGNKAIFIIDEVRTDGDSAATARVIVLSPERDSLGFAFSTQRWRAVRTGRTWAALRLPGGVMSGLLTTDH